MAAQLQSKDQQSLKQSSQQQFQRFYRKLIALRSEIYEEAEVPHLLEVDEATFSRDAAVIVKSLGYMSSNYDQVHYQFAKRRIQLVLQKIKDLKDSYLDKYEEEQKDSKESNKEYLDRYFSVNQQLQQLQKEARKIMNKENKRINSIDRRQESIGSSILSQ